jgi:hypothetical protein
VFWFASFSNADEIDPASVRAPAPNWIDTVEPIDPRDVKFTPNGGKHWLLYDNQTLKTKEDQVWYVRRVGQPVTVRGVESLASYKWTYDPTYEEVKVHHINVIRNGEIVDALSTASIEVLRQEKNLRRNILDGRETLYVRINDVRPGDIVDSAVSWHGPNPSFDNNTSHVLNLDWTSHRERQNISVKWSDDVEMNIDVPDDKIRRTRQDGLNALRFGPVPRKAVRLERGAPPGSNNLDKLHISTFRDWQHVAEIATPYFQKQIDPATAKQIEKIRSENDTPEERITSAIRFVQDDIRYQALSLGTGGWVPRDPSVVLETRFGDCKDKSTLLALMAVELGADDANVALVSTRQWGNLETRQPSMKGFDHAVTQISFDGKQYFIDGTLRNTGGTLTTMVQPWFNKALILRMGESDLTNMNLVWPNLPNSVAKHIFELSNGASEPAMVNYSAVYRGRNADRLRSQFTSNGDLQLNESFKLFYEEKFGPIEPVNAISIMDNRDKNMIQLSLSYRLLDPFLVPLSDEDDGGDLPVDAFSTVSMIPRFATRERTLPLSISAGTYAKSEIEFRLPKSGARLETEVLEPIFLENAAFYYARRAERRGNTYREVHELRPKATQVSAAVTRDVFRDIRRLKAHISNTVFVPNMQTGMVKPAASVEAP